MIKKQLLYSLIFSYVAVIVVGIVLCVSLNRIAVESIEEEITTNYEHLLDNLLINMDYILQDAENIVIDISEQPSIKELLFVEKDKTKKDNYKIVKAVENMKKISSYNSFIDEMYVYYNNLGIVVNNRGVYYPDTTYKIFHQGQVQYYDEWVKIIDSENYKGKIAKVENQLFYIQTVSTYDKKSFANIIILLDQRRLKTLLEESALSEYGYIGIVDEDNQLILSNLDEEEEKDLIGLKESDEKYVSLVKNSKKNSLKCIGVIPNKIFTQKVDYINKIFLLCTIVFVVILLTGVYFIRKKYARVRQVLNKIKNAIEIKGPSKYGELQYIEKAITNMHKEIESNKELIIENIFRKAIHGTDQSQEEIKKYLGEKFSDSHFVIASLVIEHEEDINNRKQMNEFIIENIFKDIMGEEYDLYTIESNKGYILIISFNKFTEEYIFEELIHRLSVGRNFLENNFGLNYLLFLSDIHTEVTSLAIAYEEVQKAFEYSMFFGVNKLMTYGQTLKEDTAYVYSIENHIALTKYIKEGNSEKALSLLEKVFDENFRCRNLSLGKTKKLIYDIGITLENVRYSLGASKITSISIDEKRKDLQAIYKEYKEAIISLCDQAQNTKTKKIDDKVQEVIKYIEENYDDEDLTVTAIADKFGMKVSYTSRFFKENTGENLLQYITKYRVSQAKRLLVETNKNLNDIAQEVGLLNNIALIRSFKKYEYITPNEYRNLNKEV